MKPMSFLSTTAGADIRESVVLTRVFKFCASHRLFIRGLTEEENFAIFGRCANPAGHGHDYSVEVGIKGEINQESGMVITLSEFDRLAAPIIEELNYSWIDKDIPFFRENVSTVENIGKYFWKKFSGIVPAGALLRIKVWENPRSYIEYFEGEL